jgi:hypothetical protein
LKEWDTEGENRRPGALEGGMLWSWVGSAGVVKAVWELGREQRASWEGKGADVWSQEAGREWNRGDET